MDTHLFFHFMHSSRHPLSVMYGRHGARHFWILTRAALEETSLSRGDDYSTHASPGPACRAPRSWVCFNKRGMSTSPASLTLQGKAASSPLLFSVEP